MKTTALSLVVLLTVSASASAKPIPANNIHVSRIVAKSSDVFGAFHIHRQGDFASLNWNVTSDAATSFVIERSYDGEFFDEIDEVSADPKRWNRYTDNTVEPGIIYYRISAYDANGGLLGVSSTEVVKIVKHK